MKSNYKRIGDHIRLVDERNKGLKVKTLLGLSISKQFIPSVANIIGTDMENYKIIRRNQFACSIMQVRRDKKMPVALLKNIDEAIISQAYPVFEVVDENILSPDYLMMWFTRSEYDREACFNAVGGVRGSLEWEDFLNMQLPIPHINKQREIVKEYNTIVNRIKLNELLCQKLEETARTVFKNFFVDVNVSAKSYLIKYIETNPKLELKKGCLSAYIEMADLSENTMRISGKISREYNGGSKFQNNDTLLARITPCLENGKTAFVDILNTNEIAAGSTEFIVMRAKENISPYYVYCLAKDENFRSYAISSMTGTSGRQRVHEKYLEKYEVPEIDIEHMRQFHIASKPIFELISLTTKESHALLRVKDLILSKLATIEN